VSPERVARSGAGLAVLEQVPLAPRCTMEVGGPARFLVEGRDETTVLDALDWARGRRLDVRVLGGGSNLVVADAGVDALVVHVALRGLTSRVLEDGAVELVAAAGEPWDGVVRHAVERGWAGIECLSGIPGLVGATPIQNVGAYGQEVAETVTTVRAAEIATGEVVTITNRACAFAYRSSAFKGRASGRHVVLAVGYRLRPGGAPALRYADVERHLAASGTQAPSLSDVRRAVLAIRRGKSMVIDPGDENRRSCGSFFVNPIVSAGELASIEARAGDPAMPRWPQPDGQVKLSAAWLIEHAGFARGTRAGPVGLSTRHALAIVAHDGARAADVLAFARRLQAAVQARFGVGLTPEPVFW
jgi:UDP-N-acetylmuramate dehydrogenase